MVNLVYRMGNPMTTVLMASTLLWTTLVLEIVFSANSQFRNSLISNFFMYYSKCFAVYSRVKGSPYRISFEKFIYAPFSRIRRASPRYYPCGLSYFMFSLYYSSMMSEMLGQTKKGFRWNSLQKNRVFSFQRLRGLSSLRHVAKLVAFFFPLRFSLFSLGLVSSLAYCFFFTFFSSFNFLRTFSLIIPSYFGYLKAALLAITGEGVLMPDLDKLFDAQCLMRILSDELGVRGNDGYLLIVLLMNQLNYNPSMWKVVWTHTIQKSRFYIVFRINCQILSYNMSNDFTDCCERAATASFFSISFPIFGTTFFGTFFLGTVNQASIFTITVLIILIFIVSLQVIFLAVLSFVEQSSNKIDTGLFDFDNFFIDKPLNVLVTSGGSECSLVVVNLLGCGQIDWERLIHWCGGIQMPVIKRIGKFAFMVLKKNRENSQTIIVSLMHYLEFDVEIFSIYLVLGFVMEMELHSCEIFHNSVFCD